LLLGAPRVVDVNAFGRGLPANVGPRVGTDLRFCQNDQCLGTFLERDLANPHTCPACRSPLGAVSKPEQTVLPKDTIVRKKAYAAPGGDIFVVSLIVAGQSRRSIHRPHVCIVAQGQTIIEQRVIDIPLPGRNPLSITVLDLGASEETLDSGKGLVQGIYAYWFTDGRRRETASHYRCMLWRVWDAIVSRESRRWASVAIQVKGAQAGRNRDEQLKAFVADLYPCTVSAAAGGQ